MMKRTEHWERDVPQGSRLFHNAAAATAIADRLVHKRLLVRIPGKSSRPQAGRDRPDEAA